MQVQAAGSQAKPQITTRHRILVVDDFPDAAEIACVLLELMGHECRAALSGHEALDMAAQFGPDIVILDIGLPDLSGFEVARALRATSHGGELHLAAVTGWGQPEDRMQAIAAGFDQHILKPADAHKLQAIVAFAEQHALRRS